MSRERIQTAAKRGNRAEPNAQCRPPQHVIKRTGNVTRTIHASKPVSGLTALTVASQRPEYLPMLQARMYHLLRHPGQHSGIVRDQADHRCGGSAGIVRENSPGFPLIHPVNLPDGNLYTAINYKQFTGRCNKKLNHAGSTLSR